ncbi:adenosine deaminase [Kaistia dalseonensis]|uniref:Adenine deaminase n=1 Tax=Kaistia dalseonensis TaxID=410840 RepID=A0ABU0HB40_9HYPH|nr:adenosine deaminase [Kaistia dalseonensis]MCX5496096.1 adenosine deaminase [Kaistia dalseonensis]MDQ0438701.1 adenosine deaminase [Kaistia dalseonensis]
MSVLRPKVELHCHVEGAAFPALVQRVAARNGIDLPGLFDAEGQFLWHDFSSFLGAYDQASAVFRTPEDFRDLTFTHFTSIAAEGAIYGEVFISVDHGFASGLSYADYVGGLAQGILDAEAETSIVGRMVATGVRHFGPDRVRAAAEIAANEPHPLVTGFGVAGDERMHHPRDFIDAFRIAGEAGLGLTAHAGELCGPESVRAALDHLNISRIGHGVRAIEDPALVERIVSEGVVLELCPGSNVALGLYPDIASHPFRRLMEAGVRVTVSSDDPPYFGSSIGAEYEWLEHDQQFDEAEFAQINRTAVEAAFVDEATRSRLLARLTD